MPHMPAKKRTNRDARLPETRCPFCDAVLNAAGTVEGNALPEPDDTAVCIECARVCFFTGDMTLRKPRQGEVEKLLETDKEWAAEILELQSKIRALNAKKR